MVSEAVSCRNFEETKSIPATSCRFWQELQWNRPELCGKTEAVFQPEFPHTETDDIPHIPVTGMSTDAAGSGGNHHGIIPYPTGNNNVTRRKSSETTIYLKQKNTTKFSYSFQYFFSSSPNQDYRLSDPIFYHPKILSQLCSNAIFRRISAQLLIRFHFEFQRDL